MKNKRKGFSLIELVVALSILTIGLLGVIPLAIATIKLNNVQNQMLNAKYLAERYSERFKSLSFDAPDLANDEDNNDLADTLNPDHREVQTLDNIQYTIMWNVANNADGTKTIRIIVRWYDARSRRQKSYFVETVRSSYEL
ncbi:MAG: prepilin-type N-terminal cleavage/methylation domain-containing protein [candidate division WOR-3 bacterium]